MPIYRLDPINPKDPAWDRLSSFVEALWTSAPSDDDARERVAVKTLKAHEPEHRYAPKEKSPWVDKSKSLCVMDTNRDDIKEGEVVTASGESI